MNDNTFNLHNSLLNNDSKMKVTLKSKLIGVASLLILNLHMAYKTYRILKDIFSKKSCALYAVKYGTCLLLVLG